MGDSVSTLSAKHGVSDELTLALTLSKLGGLTIEKHIRKTSV